MADTPTQEEQPVWVRLNIAKEDFDKLPPADRMRLEREHNSAPPVERRPYRPPAPLEVRQAWDGLPIAEQMAKYRAWADEQPRP